MSATTPDEESIVGDECHIIARKPDGPRGDPSIPETGVDTYPNLILLCKIHHKLVDDQPNTSTADVLRAQKRRHEHWVRETLHHAISNDERVDTAFRIATGKEALSIVLDADAFDFDYDEPENDEDLELISELLQSLHDWGDLGSVVGSGDRVKAGYELTRDIKRLEDLGFYLFGGSQNRKYQVSGQTMNFRVAVIRIVRQGSPGIIRSDVSKREGDSRNK